MSIIIDENSLVIVQGITGNQGSYHTKSMIDYGVKIVGGVTPGKGGKEVHGITVYDTVAEIMALCKIDVSMIMVPPAGVFSAATEAIENRIGTIIIITENTPLHDVMKIKALAKKYGVRLIGPNTIGVISPGKCKVGIMATFLYGQGGNIGIGSRSGTLSHEIASTLTYRGMGISSVIGVGGDPIIGTDFVDVLELFHDDVETEAIILIGEIGGSKEEEAAEYLKASNYDKPVFAFITGKYAPTGKKMGHAGAIIEKGVGSSISKINKLREAGATVASNLDDLIAEVESWHKDPKMR